MEVVSQITGIGKCRTDIQVLEENPTTSQLEDSSGLDTSKLDDILPKQFKHHVVHFENLAYPGHFKAEIRVNIFSKEEALEWLREFEELTNTNFRTRKTFKENSHKLIYKKLFRCHKNTGVPRAKVVKRPSDRNVGCSAMLGITVKNPKMRWSSDVLLQNFPCIISLKHSHCHSLTTPDTLKYRRPLPELKHKFAALFAEKISPSTALKLHKLDLQRQYGDKYHEVVNDSAKCPHLHWVYKLYYTIYQKGVKDGKSKRSRRVSGKKFKIKQEPIEEDEILQQVYMPDQLVNVEVINGADISVISETGQIEIGSCDENPPNFCHFDNLSLQTQEVQENIEVLQDNHKEYVLFCESDTGYANDPINTSYAVDASMGGDETLDHTYVQIEQTEVETDQPGRTRLHIPGTCIQFEQDGNEMEDELCHNAEEIHHEFISEEPEAPNTAAQECIGKMEKIFSDIKIKLKTDPKVFTSAQKFVSNYEQLAKSHNQDQLASALENFGLKPPVVNAIAQFAKSLDTQPDPTVKCASTLQTVIQKSPGETLPSPPKKGKIIFVKLTQPPPKKIF